MYENRRKPVDTLAFELSCPTNHAKLKNLGSQDIDAQISYFYIF